MAGTIQNKRGGMITAINVTPLVDVVLVLLIIMMVTSTYIVAHTLKVELPKTKTSDGAGEAPLILTVTAAGKIEIDGVGLSSDDLGARLRKEIAQRGELELVLSADAKVSHGEVVKYIDIAKLAGVTRFAINVLRTEP